MFQAAKGKVVGEGKAVQAECGEAPAPTMPRAPWPLLWLVGPSSRHEGKSERRTGPRKSLGELFQMLPAVSSLYGAVIVSRYPKLTETALRLWSPILLGSSLPSVKLSKPFLEINNHLEI